MAEARERLVSLGNPCVLVEFSTLVNLLRAIPLPWMKEQSLYDVNAYYQIAEDSGMRGFHFYNNWGVILATMKRFEEAIAKYKRALEFYGDDAWALLNWGQAYLLQGRYDEAEAKYRASLKIGLTGAASTGLIESLYSQAKHDDVLREFAIYSKSVSGKKGALSPRAIYLSSLSACATGNLSQASELIKQMPPEEINWGMILAVTQCVAAKKKDGLN